MAPETQIAINTNDLCIHILLPGFTLYNPCFPNFWKTFSESTLCDEPLTLLWPVLPVGSTGAPYTMMDNWCGINYFNGLSTIIHQ
jgi:hypothetical protein